MKLIIDIGNTIAKLVAFDEGEPLDEVLTPNQTLEALPLFAEKYCFESCIVSSVVVLSDIAKRRLESLNIDILHLNGETKSPIVNLYHSPSTLGPDRLAAVVGAITLKPERNILIIDAGTCITYELVDSQGNYFGGNISPGLNMRLKALEEFTSKLPLVDAEGDTPEVGYDTTTAIRSGVKEGIRYEIEGYINAFSKKYPQLLVFLTGGDAFNFANCEKNIIFADKYLVPRGLNRILEYNDK